MQAIGRLPQRAPDGAPLHDGRHRPEQTILYRLVQPRAASFIAHTDASTGSELPGFIRAEPGQVQIRRLAPMHPPTTGPPITLA